MKHLSMLIAAVALVLTQCERHSWEDVKDADGNLTEKGTKRLFEEHGSADGEAHGEPAHEGAHPGGDAEGEGHKTGGQKTDHDGDGTADH